MNAVEHRILAAMRLDSPRTITELARTLNIQVFDVREAVASLEKQQKIKQTSLLQTGKPGRPAFLWELFDADVIKPDTAQPASATTFIDEPESPPQPDIAATILMPMYSSDMPVLTRIVRNTKTTGLNALHRAIRLADIVTSTPANHVQKWDGEKWVVLKF